jgi:hypothetical protein
LSLYEATEVIGRSDVQAAKGSGNRVWWHPHLAASRSWLVARPVRPERGSEVQGGLVCKPELRNVIVTEANAVCNDGLIGGSSSAARLSASPGSHLFTYHETGAVRRLIDTAIFCQSVSENMAS